MAARSAYATAYMTIHEFRALLTKFRTASYAVELVKQPIAEIELSKIEKYDNVLYDKMVQSEKVLDHRLGIYIIGHSDLLRT